MVLTPDVEARPFIEPLLTADQPAGAARGGVLPEELRLRYGSDLAIPLRTDRPTVIANFVSTLDGVVSYNVPGAASGGPISGHFEPDRFLMGLLRALADVVLIGAGTMRASRRGRWTPESVHEASADAYAELRRDLGLAAVPTTVVVSASGELDPNHTGLTNPAVPVVVLTTDRGAAHLEATGLGSHVEVVAAGTDRVDPERILEEIGNRGAQLALCEGGPQLFGAMTGAGLIDELFLTIAPQIAGRSDAEPRLSLVEDKAFAVAQAPWSRLVDIRRSGSHLFTRYRFEGETRGSN